MKNINIFILFTMLALSSSAHLSEFVEREIEVAESVHKRRELYREIRASADRIFNQYYEQRTELIENNDLVGLQALMQQILTPLPEGAPIRFVVHRRLLESYKSDLRHLNTDDTHMMKQYYLFLISFESELYRFPSREVREVFTPSEFAIGLSRLAAFHPRHIPASLQGEWSKHILRFFDFHRELLLYRDKINEEFRENLGAYRTDRRRYITDELRELRDSDPSEFQRRRAQYDQYSKVLELADDIDWFIDGPYRELFEERIMRSITSFYRENPESLFVLHEILETSSLSDRMIAKIWQDVRPGAARLEQEVRNHKTSSSTSSSDAQEPNQSMHPPYDINQLDEESIGIIRKQLQKHIDKIWVDD